MDIPTSIPQKATNWDEYYARPFPFSRLTKRITAFKVLSLLKMCNLSQNTETVELGGGNSFFFPYFDRFYHPQSYTVVDRNRVGLDIFRRRYAESRNAKTICADLTDSNPDDIKADIVFSFGLIEHFSAPQTAHVLKKHFDVARPGSIVLITFPTPHVPYKLIRGCAEHLGMWKFPDERPLELSEVRSTCEKYGHLLAVHINRLAFLTQAITLWRAN